MSNNFRFLITTSDERTWQFDKPVIFLGGWCTKTSRNIVWQNLDFIVAEPYKPGYSDCIKEIEFVQKIVVDILSELSASLNQIHSTDYSERYWNILLGHWLRRYVSVIFNRYHTLEQAFNKYSISGVAITTKEDYSLVANDSLSFISLCRDNQWNQIIYTKIINFWQISDLFFFEVGDKGFREDLNLKEPKTIKRSLINWCKEKVLTTFIKDTDAVISTTYMPMLKEFELQLSLNQSPQFWYTPKAKPKLPDKELRSKLLTSDKKFHGFEQFVRLFLPDVIPICFLEGYQAMTLQAKKLPWPSNPKFIFTSNRFDFDEIFKTWTAFKVERGVPYFVGQHGSNYGTLFGTENSPEQITPDKFITWGWTNGFTRNLPAFNFKLAGKGNLKSSGNKLLLIEFPPPAYHGIHDEHYRFSRYMEEQFQFVTALPKNIRKKLIVRLHSASKNFDWNEEGLWKDHFADINVDSSSSDIFKQLKESKLIVHSYDSTGILETLALNIPTICFWQGGLSHLLSHARPFYELLQNAGILAESPEQAAILIEKYWNNIDEWWLSEEVQNARIKFCQQYSKVVPSPVKTLKKLLLEQI